jgi:uncharacterized YigZ family protein
MEEFITILKNETTEIVEKKSKFISYTYYVENEEEIAEKIKELRKKYYDARHICFAWRIVKDGQILERANDDGEPSGTAGAPILNILKKNNLCNILLVVIRYFGGILLGTGGLVRAYSEATQKVIEKSSIISKVRGIEIIIRIDYSDLEIFKYYCKNNNINITDLQYLDDVIVKIEMEKSRKAKMLENIDTKTLKIKEYKVVEEKYINKTVETNT